MNIADIEREEMAADLADRGNPNTRMQRLARLLGYWLAHEWVAANPPKKGEPLVLVLDPNDPMYVEWRQLTHAAIELAIYDEQYPAGADPEGKYLNPRPLVQ